jgi:methylated-DNA-[protein]-cysteine S-methyltransferase
MFYDIFVSSLGKITIAADENHVTELHIEEDRYFNNVPPSWKQNSNHPLLNKAMQEITEYFNNQRTEFDLPLSFKGTIFQEKVWNAILEIPYGKTITYKMLAEKIGSPKAIRAVGTAVGRNPICIIIPCHRILASDGSLGGYVAGLKRKEKLLSLEKSTQHPQEQAYTTHPTQFSLFE